MNKGKVYCFTDLHGDTNLFKQIKNFIQVEDKVFVLGDVVDRGTKGWKS
jgi:Icc-related predicted phosphoesterase